MEKKICSKCKIEKDVCEFYKNSKKEGKVRTICKKCMNKSSYDYSKKNKEKLCEIKEKYVTNNKEKVKNSKKKWFDKNPTYKKEWYEKNIDKILETNKNHYYKNRDERIAYSKKYMKKNKLIINEKNKQRYKVDVIFKLKQSIRTRINKYLKSKKIEKNRKIFHIVGCSIDLLKEHLEKQFKSGMTWENYGLFGWHIDHIIPLASAKTEEEIYTLCHYTNLQPLWAEENLTKNKKIIN